MIFFWMDWWYRDVIASKKSLIKYFKNLIPRNPRKVLKDFPGCGKRYERNGNEPKYGECLWDCEEILMEIYFKLKHPIFNCKHFLVKLIKHIPSDIQWEKNPLWRDSPVENYITFQVSDTNVSIFDINKSGIHIVQILMGVSFIFHFSIWHRLTPQK